MNEGVVIVPHSLFSSLQMWTNAASNLTTSSCATTFVTTTLVVSTAPVDMATYSIPTTAPAEVRLPGLLLYCIENVIECAGMYVLVLLLALL